ncbi:MAG: polysaccharide biosynthesis C-terminal domain-containing protein [candidate division Zixibacteria bacterium]|nr:polysaccharide biosynthesis C-terminal domain-containing protein [candidate division Zixibacteria bacterium]
MKRLVKNMSIYGMGSIAARAIQVILLPIYTRFLSPADYGSLELVYMVAGVLAILYGLMIGSGYLRTYYDSSDQTHRDRVLGSAFWFTLFCAIPVGGAALLFSGDLADAVFTFEGGSAFITLIAVATAIKAHNYIFYNLLIVREKAGTYVAINIITMVVTIGITIYFVVFMHWAVRGILLAQVIAYGLEFALLAFLLMRRSLLMYSAAAVKEMLALSIPLIPLQFASFVLTMADRLFLQEYRTLDEVGLYSLAYKFASIMPFLVIEPFKAFGPHLFSLIDQPEKCKRTLADFTRYYMAGGMLFALVIAIFSREVIMLMSTVEYYEAHRVVFLLCLSYVFYGLTSLTGYAINIVKKNWIIGLSWVIGAALNVGLNFILIPAYGMVGAASATIASYLVVALGRLIIIRRVYPVPFAYGSFVGIVIAGTVCYLVSTLLHFDAILSIAAKIVLLALFTAGLAYGYLNAVERDEGLRLLRSLWARFHSKA